MSTPPSAPTLAATEPTAYERDFYTWALEQAALIRAGRLATIDRDNVAEEIECLGKEQFAKLRSAYRVLLLHMLKWDHQPERRSRSWIASIVRERVNIADILEDNPSLRSRVTEAIAKGYRGARSDAAAETGLAIRTYPAQCPYGPEDILTREFELRSNTED